MIKSINGIKDIVKLYDTFILDQWGVMHDGINGYDHAIECVNYLKKNNKNIIIISNSSKRKLSSIKRLPNLGFNQNMFDELITSGEMVWQQISSSLNYYGKDLNKCFHMFNESKEDGFEFRDGLNNITFVADIENADFILACTPYENSTPIDYIPALKLASDKNLLMFCANPDFETIEKDHSFCMGTIADLYEHMGGKVVILGKPSKIIYQEATKNLDQNLSKIVAIGDSLLHDIQGAKNFGIDSVLITSGIHKEIFLQKNYSWNNHIKINKKLDIPPTYICNIFAI